MANSGNAVDVYDGRPTNDLLIEVSRHSVSGNSTRWAWKLTARRHSYASYVLDKKPWSVNVEGDVWTGSSALDFRSTDRIVLGSGITGWKTHNSSGQLTVNFSAGHNVGSIFGSANPSGSFAANQLPTLPAAPIAQPLDQITAGGFRLRYKSNGGGTASVWRHQISDRADFGTTVQTGTGSGTVTISGLTPGRRYWARVRGENGFGLGAWSTSVDATLLLLPPDLVSWAQTADGKMVATWADPDPSTGLTGFRLQVAYDAGFTQSVQNIDLDAATRSHSVAGGVGGRQYHARVATRSAAGLSAYSGPLTLVLVLSAGDLDGWARIGTTPTGLAYFTAQGIRRGTAGGSSALIVETIATGAATIDADATGIQRVVSGLTPGKAYRFEAAGQLTGSPVVTGYRLRVLSESAADVVTLGEASTSLGYIEFVADAASATLQILAGETVQIGAAEDEIERAAFTGVRLLQLLTDYPVRLRETVYESNLANHFDLACNSVGASWYVGKDGVTRFRLPGAALPVAATFTDRPAPGALHYIDVAAAYDTRGMVNRLDVTNKGVDDAREREQNDELVATDAASIAAYGVRSARLETNLWDQAPYDESLSARLQTLLAGAAEPRLFVSSCRWNAQEDLAAANALEVGQRVIVQFNGTEQDSQIVALQHDITPRRWIVTATFRRL